MSFQIFKILPLGILFLASCGQQRDDKDLPIMGEKEIVSMVNDGKTVNGFPMKMLLIRSTWRISFLHAVRLYVRYLLKIC